MLRLGIGAEGFMCAGVLLLKWHGENVAYEQHLKFCHFQSVHCGGKNPISPKVFNRFSKSLPQLEDVEGGNLGGKFLLRRYFTFAMAIWKLCASTTFEILPLSTYTLCQQISYISKGIQSIFEIFASARRCWGRACEGKVSSVQVFFFCDGKVTTLRIENIWNFATFNLYIVPEKVLYHQRYSTDFRNLCLSSKTLRVGIWMECFRCAGVLLLEWQGENSADEQHLKFCHFQPVHCASKNPISPKVFNRFRNLCLSSKMLRVGIRVECLRCAGILLLQWKGENFAHRHHLKFCHFQPVVCVRKILYLQRYQPTFEIIASARRCWRWAFGWKVSGAQVFYFFNGKEKTLHMNNIWNFRTFNLYTVPAKIPYLQRYSTYFRYLCLSSKMLSVGIWAESLWCEGILILQWKGQDFARRLHLKFCHFKPLHCASKKLISPKVFNPIFEIVASTLRGWGWALGRKVWCALVYYFWNGKAKTLHMRRFEILPLSTCTLCQQISYISKGIQPIFEIFASARRCWGWTFGCKVSSAQVSHLWQWQGENFAHRQHLKFWHFQPVHCASKNPISPKVFNRFSKSLRQLVDVEGGHLGGKFQVRRYFSFAMAIENFAHRQHFKFCHFQPVHCASKNPISPKYLTLFSKLLPQLEEVEVGHWGGRFDVRRCITFEMARRKLCI